MKTKKDRFDKIAQLLRMDLQKTCQLTQDSILRITEAVKAGDLIREYESGILSHQEVAIVRQILEIDAKRVPTDVGRLPDENCWRAFVSSQEQCAKQNAALLELSNKSDPVLLNILLIAAGLLDEAAASVDENLSLSDQGKFLWSDWDTTLNVAPFKYPVTGFGSGPGVCANTEFTDLVSKFEMNGAFSTSAVESARLGRIQESIVCDVLSQHTGLKHLKLHTNVQNAIVGCYAPKKKDISRFIGPQLNGDLLLQYPMAHFMTHMLSYFGINLDKQPDVNRECARSGSLYDGYSIPLNDIVNVRNRKPQWCTIDLKTASDLVGLVLNMLMFPHWMFTYMMATRCDTVIEPVTGESVKLECMATMGNAFCFPMQTLVFAAICKAVNIVLGIPADRVHVFGDDIIVDRKAYPYVIDVLRSLHMVPNVKKSFCSGHFRESCGGDFYKGYQVRPISPRNYDSLADVYTVTNQLLDWYEEHNLVMGEALTKALAQDLLFFHRKFNKLRNKKLKGGARHQKPFFLVPRFANMSDGLRVTCRTIASFLAGKSRIGEALHTVFHFQLRDFDPNPYPAFGHFADDDSGNYQTEVVKYSYLKTEPTYRELSNDELQPVHCSGVSGRWVFYSVSDDGDKVYNFHVAGRSDGRAVQRRSLIPFHQWDVNPEGAPYYTSMNRLASEMRLIHALLFNSAAPVGPAGRNT